jgi:hypothetical protein
MPEKSEVDVEEHTAPATTKHQNTVNTNEAIGSTGTTIEACPDGGYGWVCCGAVALINGTTVRRHLSAITEKHS